MIDKQSALWAHGLGWRARSFNSGVRATSLCPFDAGTPQRKYWMQGWRNGVVFEWMGDE
jgi:ribosome modulation factor